MTASGPREEKKGKGEILTLTPMTLDVSGYIQRVISNGENLVSTFLAGGYYVHPVRNHHDLEILNFFKNTRTIVHAYFVFMDMMRLFRVSAFHYGVVTPNNKLRVFNPAAPEDPIIDTVLADLNIKKSQGFELCPQDNNYLSVILSEEQESSLYLIDLKKNTKQFIEKNVASAIFLFNQDLCVVCQENQGWWSRWKIKIFMINYQSLVAELKEEYVLPIENGKSLKVSFSPCNHSQFIILLENPSKADEFRLFQIRQGKLEQLISRDKKGLFDLRFLPDGSLLAQQRWGDDWDWWSCWDRWEIRNKAVISLGRYNMIAQNISISPDGYLIYRDEPLLICDSFKKGYEKHPIQNALKKIQDIVENETSLPHPVARLVADYAAAPVFSTAFSVPVREGVDLEFARRLESLNQELELGILRASKPNFLGNIPVMELKKWADEKAALHFFVDLLKHKSEKMISFAECLTTAIDKFPKEMKSLLDKLQKIKILDPSIHHERKRSGSIKRN